MWFSPMAYSIQRYVIFMCVQLLLREKWCPMRKRLQKYYIRDFYSFFSLRLTKHLQFLTCKLKSELEGVFNKAKHRNIRGDI